MQERPLLHLTRALVARQDSAVTSETSVGRTVSLSKRMKASVDRWKPLELDVGTGFSL